MKKIATLFALLALAACGGPPMSNEKIIAESNQCKVAGLVARQFYNSSGEVVKIQCFQPSYH